jgi:hypothetical protein
MFNYNNTFQKDFIEPHKINNMNSFIHGYFIGKKDIGLCDELVNHYIHKEKIDFYGNQACELDNDPSLAKKIDDQLYLCISSYAKSYPASVVNIPGVVEKCIIQSSENGKPYNAIETVTVSKNTRRRHLGFLMFLSDTPKDGEGGYVSFYHQKISVKPEKGLILVYPDNWQFIYMVDACDKELYWLSGHLSSITEDEKFDNAPKIQMVPAPTSEDISYKIIN